MFGAKLSMNSFGQKKENAEIFNTIVYQTANPVTIKSSKLKSLRLVEVVTDLCIDGVASWWVHLYL